MELSMLLALVLGGIAATPQGTVALGRNDAEDMFEAFNNAFLTTLQGDTFYKTTLHDQQPDHTWQGSLDILGAAADAYERTGDPEKKDLVNDLLTTWLKRNPPLWNWDGYNDDIGWFTLALIRGYQITGNENFLSVSKDGFDYGFSRGWETNTSDGGIWEENPEWAEKEDPPKRLKKEALSNDSLGMVACLIYQSTHDIGYLQKCQQIYDWVWHHLYDSNSGQVYTGVYQNGELDTQSAVYNQGAFLELANLLYKITGNVNIYNDAQRAIDYARNSETAKGIFSNSDTHLNTWADEMARGAGMFVRDNRLWGKYYSWMVKNADAILANRRNDWGITWNAWDQLTPNDDTLITNKFVSAVSWLQYTPASQPNNIGGIHVITNKATGMAIDSAGVFNNGQSVIQWGQNNGQNQRWLLTQNSDTTWNIINMATWKALDCPGGFQDNNITMLQWQPTRESNQRWLIDQQGDGTYKIRNQASGAVLDGSSSMDNNSPLIQWGWNGGPQQRWILQ